VTGPPSSVFLTGATGYVGRSVLARLTEADVRVRCLVLPDDPDPPAAGGLVEVVEGDVTRPDGLAAAGDGVEAVVHSAALMPPARAERIRQVNVEGTRTMLELARGWGVSRFVYLSAVSATYPVRNAYGESKLECEEMVRASGLQHTILRPTMVFGPGGGLHFQELVALVRRAPVVFPVIGPGAQRLQPVAIEDVVRAVELALSHPAAANRTYAVSGATVLSFDELVDRVAEALGRRRLKVHVPLALCRALARGLERVRPEPLLSVDAVTGVTQDATLDWSPFARDCGYSPQELDARLASAVA
jgi:NADH dehydrogenase